MGTAPRYKGFLSTQLVTDNYLLSLTCLYELRDEEAKKYQKNKSLNDEELK